MSLYSDFKKKRQTEQQAAGTTSSTSSTATTAKKSVTDLLGKYNKYVRDDKFGAASPEYIARQKAIDDRRQQLVDFYKKQDAEQKIANDAAETDRLENNMLAISKYNKAANAATNRENSIKREADAALAKKQNAEMLRQGNPENNQTVEDYSYRDKLAVKEQEPIARTQDNSDNSTPLFKNTGKATAGQVGASIIRFFRQNLGQLERGLANPTGVNKTAADAFGVTDFRDALPDNYKAKLGVDDQQAAEAEKLQQYRSSFKIGSTLADKALYDKEQAVNKWSDMENTGAGGKVIAGAAGSAFEMLMDQVLTRKLPIAGDALMFNSAFSSTLEEAQADHQAKIQQARQSGNVGLVEELQNNDPLNNEAVWTRAMGSGLIEVASERTFNLFSGIGGAADALTKSGVKGLKPAVQTVVKGFFDNFSEKAGKVVAPTLGNFIKYLGAKAGEEGFEEVMADLGNGILAKLTTDREATLATLGFGVDSGDGLINAEDTMYSFLSGALMGLVASGANGLSQFKNTRNYIESNTGLKMKDISQEHIQRLVDNLNKDMENSSARDELLVKMTDGVANEYAANQEFQQTQLQPETVQMQGVNGPVDLTATKTQDGQVELSLDGKLVQTVTKQQYDGIKANGTVTQAKQATPAVATAPQAVDDGNLPAQTAAPTTARTTVQAPQSRVQGQTAQGAGAAPAAQKQSTYYGKNGKQVPVRSFTDGKTAVVEISEPGTPLKHRIEFDPAEYQAADNKIRFLMTASSQMKSADGKPKAALFQMASKFAGNPDNFYQSLVTVADGITSDMAQETAQRAAIAPVNASKPSVEEVATEAQKVAEKDARGKESRDLTEDEVKSVRTARDIAREAQEGKIDKAVLDGLKELDADLESMNMAGYFNVTPAHYMTASLKAMQKIIEDTTSKRVVFVNPVGAVDANEFVTRKAKDIIFVNSKKAVIPWAIGHGMYHLMVKDGTNKAFEAAAMAAMGKTREELIDQTIAYYEKIPAMQDRYRVDPDAAFEEAIADRAGEIFASSEFWQQLDSQGTIGQKIMTKLQEWLQAIKKSYPVTTREVDAIMKAIDKAKEQAPVVEKKVDKTENTLIATYGNKAEVAIRANEYIEVQYAVADINEIIASHDTYGNVNPDYDQRLQPRDRERAVSQAWVLETANTLDPRQLAESNNIQFGSPIIGRDGMVESGNGRAMAIKEAFKQKNKAFEKYRQYIIDNAERFGIDKASVPANPMLVRVRTTELDRAQFAMDTNARINAAMSISETARSYSGSLTNEILGLLDVGVDGNVGRAKNRAFNRAFIESAVPKMDYGTYIDSEGDLSQDGVKLIQNVLLYRAYGDMKLIEKISESTDNDMKNITNAMTAIAPRLVMIQNGIRKGDYYDVDFSKDIASAAREYARVKEGIATKQYTSFDDYLKQISLIDGISPEASDIFLFLNDNKLSGTNIREFFSYVFDNIEHGGSPTQLSLFDQGKTLTKQVAYALAMEQFEAAQAEKERAKKDAQKELYEGRQETLDVLARADQEEQTGSRIQEPAKEEVKPAPVKMTEEEYLSSKGYSGFYSEPGLHSPGGGKNLTAAIKASNAKAKAFSDKQAQLREEYRELVKRGEIVPKTSRELTEEAANGHPDNESTQAARRRLERLNAKDSDKADIEKMNKAAAVTNKEYADKVFASGEATWSNYEIFVNRMGKEAFISKYPELAYMIGSSNHEAWEAYKKSEAKAETSEYNIVPDGLFDLALREVNKLGIDRLINSVVAETGDTPESFVDRIINQTAKWEYQGKNSVQTRPTAIQMLSKSNLWGESGEPLRKSLLKLAQASGSNKRGYVRLTNPTAVRSEAISAYEQKRLDKVERLRELANKAQRESTSRLNTAMHAVDGIEPGQPILVGHHSEKRHRAALEKMDINMRKSIDASEKADYYERRAESAESNKAISMDDPAAVEKLTAKVAELEAQREQIKAANAKRKAEGKEIAPAYVLQNLGANIRATKLRLEQAQKLDAKREQTTEPKETYFDGASLVENVEANRIQFRFNGKPSDKTIDTLKHWGFRWAPSEGVWQRQLNGNGQYAARQVVKALDLKDSSVQYSMRDESDLIQNTLDEGSQPLGKGMRAHKGNRAFTEEYLKKPTLDLLTDAHKYYKVQGNPETIRNAAAELDRDERLAWAKARSAENVSPEATAMRLYFMRRADILGDAQDAADWAFVWNKSNMLAGRAVQLNVILKKMSVEANNIIVQREILGAIDKTKLAEIKVQAQGVAEALRKIDEGVSEYIFESVDDIMRVLKEPDLYERIKQYMSELGETEHDPVKDFIEALHGVLSSTKRYDKMPNTSDPVAFMKWVTANKDTLTEDISTAYEIMSNLSGNDPMTLAEIQAYFRGIMPPAIGTESTTEVTPELQAKINKALFSHFKEDIRTFNAMVRRLIDLGIDPADATLIARSAQRQIARLTREEKMRAVRKLMPTGRKSEPFLIKLVNLSNQKGVTENDIVSFIAQAQGLPGMTPEMVRDIMDWSRQIENINEQATIEDRPLTYEEERYQDIMMGLIKRRISLSLNVKLGQKIDFVDSMFLMSTPKTSMRNIVGNAAYGVVDLGKDLVESGIDSVIAKFTGKHMTGAPVGKALAHGFVRGIKESTYDITHGIYTAGINTGWDAPRGIILKSKPGQAATLLFRLAMEMPDRAFQTAYYESSIAAQQRMHKTTEITEEMQEVALYDAMRKTFADDNVLTELFGKFRRGLNKFSTAGKSEYVGLGSLIVKFSRVPANLLMRTIEYSPASFFRSLYYLGKPIAENKTNRKGYWANFDQKKFTTSLANGLYGSAMTIGVGALLTSLGLMTGRPEDDEDKRAALDSMGIGRGYMVNWSGLWRFLISGLDGQAAITRPGDTWSTYSWFSPMNIGIGIGANIVQDTRDLKAEDEDKVTELLSNFAFSTMSGIESITEMSLLSGIKSFMNDMVYSKNIGQALLKSVVDIPSRAIPNIIKSVKEMTDNTYRNTYSKDLAVYAQNLLINKLPGASKTLAPNIDMLGNLKELYQANGNNLWNVFFNPANVYKYQPNEAAIFALSVMAQAEDEGIKNGRLMPEDVLNTIKYKEVGAPVTLTDKERADLTSQIRKAAIVEWAKIPADLPVDDAIDYKGKKTPGKISLMNSIQNDVAKAILMAYQAKKLAEKANTSK